MSYGELVKELKLEDRIIAVTRVSSQNEKLNDVGGCIYKSELKELKADRHLQVSQLCQV